MRASSNPPSFPLSSPAHLISFGYVADYDPPSIQLPPCSPLLEATRAGSIESVRLLLQQPRVGEQLAHKERKGGLIPLMVACVAGHAAVAGSLLSAGGGAFAAAQCRAVNG